MPLSKSLAPTPYFVIDASRLLRNAQKMLKIAEKKGVTLRPHIKTHKVLELARIQTNKDRPITVSTFSEMEEFYRHGFRNILYAIPFSMNKCERFLPFAKEDTSVLLMVDDLETTRHLSERLSDVGKKVSVRIKIDIGSGRAGVPPKSQLLYDLVNVIHTSTSLHLDGIMSHAHHAYQATSVEHIREIAAKEVDIMTSVALDLRNRGVDVKEVSIGSTPTCVLYQEWEGITEIRPGNYILFDEPTPKSHPLRSYKKG